MATQTTSSYIRFHSPFMLEECRETLPAGLYKVTFEEGCINDFSLTERGRPQVRLYLPIDNKHSGITETLILDDPQMLFIAFAKDKEANKIVVLKETPTLPQDMRSITFDSRALARAENEGMICRLGARNMHQC